MIYTILRQLNKLCVKKLLSLDSYFDYVCKKYYKSGTVYLKSFIGKVLLQIRGNSN